MTTPYGGPRHRVDTDQQRLRNSLASSGAMSANGRTGEARPVQTARDVQIYQPPAAAANAVEAFGYFGYSTNDYPCDGTNVPFDSVSGDTAFFALVAGTTGFFVALPEYGAYYAQFYGQVSGVDPGDVYMLILGYGSEDGGPGSGIAYGIADASGNAQLSAATAIDKTGGLAGTGVFNVSIQKISGTGTTPVLSSGSALLLVNKLAGTY